MKVLADQQIPLVDSLFQAPFEVETLASEAIDADSLQGIDILLCRSVTRVDANLLKKSQLKIVASATSGLDHIDQAYLHQRNIDLFAAAGANAPAVVDYVTSIIALFSTKYEINIRTVAIIGVGDVGRRLQQRCEQLGIRCLLNDPPRAGLDAAFDAVDLSQLYDADLVSLHTPLTFNGSHPTHHLIDKAIIKSFKPGAILVNAARGGVLDEAALLEFGGHLHLCLDVFEGEPNINPAILERCNIATPHIAGHAIESKWRATHMLHQAICLSLGIKQCTPQAKASTSIHSIDPSQEANALYRQILSHYDPQLESQQLKQAHPEQIHQRFKRIRAAHTSRHEINLIK